MTESNKYFSELSRALRGEGFQTDQEDEKFLKVECSGEPVCKIDRDGTVYYDSPLDDELLSSRLTTVFRNSGSVREFLKAYESAPPLEVAGLNAYRKLADFNGYCFAAKDSKYGMEFVTWARDNYGGVTLGHYFSGGYETAKEDFALRCGLVNSQKLFSKEELTQLFQCVDYCMANADSEIVDYEDYQKLEDIRFRITELVPELEHQPEQGQQMN